MPRGPGKKSLLERFWEKVRVTDDCWEWVGCIQGQGYGNFWVAGKYYRAHRLSYQMFNGLIVDRDVFVCHRCDNPRCVNPEHLFAGSAQDNTNDMMAKGRNADFSGRSVGVKNNNCFLTEDQARAIKYSKGLITAQSLADRYGISYQAVWRIHQGEAWAYL